jgi:hypothetical protein
VSKSRVRVQRRREARRSALAVIVALYLGRTILAAPASLEYQVKAAFLYNFVSFTAWPVAAFDSPSSPLRTCVLGGEAFVTELERIVQGEAVDGHPLVVERPLRPLELKRCHVLFIAREETARTADVIRDLGTAPVLTVGESDVFWHHGGIVNFVVDGGHVRFDINQQSAQQRRLVFSSKLLNVARRVQ